jgi:hypothetical protein
MSLFNKLKKLLIKLFANLIKKLAKLSIKKISNTTP